MFDHPPSLPGWPRFSRRPSSVLLPVHPDESIRRGWLVCLNPDGLGVRASDARGLRFVGVASSIGERIPPADIRRALSDLREQLGVRVSRPLGELTAVAAVGLPQVDSLRVQDGQDPERGSRAYVVGPRTVSTSSKHGVYCGSFRERDLDHRYWIVDLERPEELS